jgi:hypothetical protein
MIVLARGYQRFYIGCLLLASTTVAVSSVESGSVPSLA